MANNTDTSVAEDITHILFASQTGNAEGVAYDLGEKISGAVMDMADVSTDDFKSFKNVIMITSTHGEGDHPDNGQILWDALQNMDRIYCNFAVLGLGDKSYEFFAKPSGDWDEFLENRGGSRKLELLKLDIDFEEQAEIWMDKVQSTFGGTTKKVSPKTAVSSNNTKVLFASQTGNAEGVAFDLANKLGVSALDMADVSADDFSAFENVVMVTSTHGEGNHPDNGQILWDALQNIDRVSCNFAVVGLGDKSYEFFCKPSGDWDEFLENRGGSRKIELLKLDVDFEEQADIWIDKAKATFGKLGGGLPAVDADNEEAVIAKENNTKVLTDTPDGIGADLTTTLTTALGVNPINITDISADDFASFKNVIIIKSTDDSGKKLYDTLQGIERLYCNFAVVSLGGTDKHSEDLDELLENRGGSRRIDLFKVGQNSEDPIKHWLEKATDTFAQLGTYESTRDAQQKTAKNKLVYTKNNPYMGAFLTNTVLSKQGSDKQVHHFEFEVKDLDISYEAGDALGIIPLNSEKLVNAVLKAGGFDGNQQVGDKKLTDILTQNLEIRTPNKDFIKAVAEKSNNEELKQIITDKKALDDYLWGREVMDLLNDYDVKFTALEFVELMKPLQHRFYSIASSPKPHPTEVHLTVSAVKYDFNNRPCEGVASCFLGDYLPVGEKVGLFIQPNKAFSIPEDGTAPIIMVGPGTGIAPFRGFIQERIATGATGKNWLFFGDRTKNDYLYQEKLESWEKYGKIRLSLAWSREKDMPKTYVQDLMRLEGKELFDELEKGAYFYVCGDASRMAKDVETALLEIIASHGKMSAEEATDYLNTLKKAKRYVRDVY